LNEAHKNAGKLYHEFLRVPSMSMGLYVLPAGSTDPQSPHAEDEAYYVVSGKGQFWVDGVGEMPALPGDTLFVPAHAAHKFHTIEEELRLLVFFAPPES
jgi:mannose-6-phosphate isomerase-like protein (cupin superfamily)